MILFFLSFSCFSLIANLFRLVGGYSFVRFIILYIFSASLKKLEISEKVSAIQAFGGIVLLTAVVWLLVRRDFNAEFMNIHLRPDTLISHVSPFTVTAAALNVSLFSKAGFSSRINKVISILAPGTFAVYLINTHPCLWLNEFENRFTAWANLRTAEALSRVLIYAGAFVIASLLIDKLCQILFTVLRLQPGICRLLYGPE